MEEISGEVPLSPAGLKVGIVFNIKGETAGDTPDDEAEYDSIETVYAIRDALKSGGFDVVLLEADKSLPQKLQNAQIDIAFNIAEGARGRGRECEVPAILNLFGIPFTGSDETALCLALDKALCKRILTTHRIRTPKYALIHNENDLRAHRLRYPVIVKPNAEGSSKGIHDCCVAKDKEALLSLVRENFARYREPMLVEEYVEGREFTVGILGNGKEARAFPPMEIRFHHSPAGGFNVYSYGVKQDYTRYVEYVCPAKIDPKIDASMRKTALSSFRALGCSDFARADFRLAEDGTLYFIEINPLPGLAPGYSDYPMLAEFCGVNYENLVLSVLRAALVRLGMGGKQ